MAQLLVPPPEVGVLPAFPPLFPTLTPGLEHAANKILPRARTARIIPRIRSRLLFIALLYPFKKSVRCSSLFAACAMNTDVLGTCVAQAEIGPTLYSTPYYNRVGLGFKRVRGFVGAQTSSIFRFGAFLAAHRCVRPENFTSLKYFNWL